MLENKALHQRQSMSRDLWRHHVRDSLEAANVDVEHLPSGAIRIVKGSVHLTITDLAAIRDSELQQLTR